MGKWYGNIGFEVMKETAPSVWAPDITMRKYFGELTRNTRQWNSGQHFNSELTVRNVISIIADPYAQENFHSIRCAEFMGALWQVTDIDVQYPRLNLTLGGEYNSEPQGPRQNSEGNP